MFTHCLVPLDGSYLAESALPAAAHLAETLHLKVTLLHVIEKDAPQQIHRDRHLTRADEASEYLRRLAAEHFPAGTDVAIHVHTSPIKDVAKSIVEHAGELGAADLVVMCTHGNSGLHDFMFGSIAQQVVAQQRVAVMLVPPAPEGGEMRLACGRFLVPLDGHPEHEQSLKAARFMAKGCGAELHLLMVIPTYDTLSGERAAASRLLPGATTAMLELNAEAALDYLRSEQKALEAENLIASGEVSRGDAPYEIARAADEIKADLVVLGTHGKTGLAAFWKGSVLPKILGQVRRPMLLVPVSGQKA